MRAWPRIAAMIVTAGIRFETNLSVKFVSSQTKILVLFCYSATWNFDVSAILTIQR